MTDGDMDYDAVAERRRNPLSKHQIQPQCGECIYGHTYSGVYRKSKDRPGKVANPACGQLNRENEYFPVPVRA